MNKDREEALRFAAGMCLSLSKQFTPGDIQEALPVAVSEESVLSAISEWSQGVLEGLSETFVTLSKADDCDWDRFVKHAREKGAAGP